MTNAQSPHVVSVHKDPPCWMLRVRGMSYSLPSPRIYAANRRSIVPSRLMRTTNGSPVVVIGVRRRNVGGDNGGWWPFPACLAVNRCRRRSLTVSRSLDFHLSSDYHNCSRCFF